MGKTIHPLPDSVNELFELERKDPLSFIEALATGGGLALLRSGFVAWEEVDGSANVSYQAETDRLKGIRRTVESGLWEQVSESYGDYLHAILARIAVSVVRQFRDRIRGLSTYEQAGHFLSSRSAMLDRMEVAASDLEPETGSSALTSVIASLRVSLSEESLGFVIPGPAEVEEEEVSDQDPYPLARRVFERREGAMNRKYSDAEVQAILLCWDELANRHSGETPSGLYRMLVMSDELKNCHGQEDRFPDYSTVRTWVRKAGLRWD